MLTAIRKALLVGMIPAVLFAQQVFYDLDAQTRALFRFDEAAGDTAYDISGTSVPDGHYFLVVQGDWFDEEVLTGVRIKNNTAACLYPYPDVYNYPQMIEEHIKVISCSAFTYFNLFDFGNFELGFHDSLFISDNISHVQSMTPFPVNEWVDVAWQNDNGWCKIFLNGKLVGKATGTVSGISSPWFVGRNDAESLEVLIDEIRISNIARYVDTGNHEPIIITQPKDTCIMVDSLFYLRTISFDFDGDSIEFTCIQAPMFISMDSTGTLSGVPYDTGLYLLKVSVSDGQSVPDTLRHTLRVMGHPANRPPIFDSHDQRSVLINYSLYDTVFANDPDGDIVSYNIIEAPDSIDIDGVTGIIRYRFTVPGDFSVSIQSTDRKNRYDTLSFNVHVYANSAPIFLNIFSEEDTVVEAMTPFLYYLSISDSNNDRIILTLIKYPDSLRLNQDSNIITWTPRSQDTGSYLVSLRVSDTLGASDTLSFNLVVCPFNHPPEIISTPNYTTNALTIWTYFVVAIDPDGDSIHYYLGDHPSGMTINGFTILWHPMRNQMGTCCVEVVAQDIGGKSDTQTIILNVLPSPYELAFYTLLPADNHVYITETDTLTFCAELWNGDSTAQFWYRIYLQDSVTSDTNKWIMRTDYLSNGRCTVTVVAGEGMDSIEYSWYVTIYNKSIPPQIIKPINADSLWGDSLLVWRVSDPDFNKDSGIYNIEFYRDSLLTRCIYTVDSIFDTSVVLKDIIRPGYFPDSTMIFWRVAGREPSGYHLGFSTPQHKFFFCMLEDIAVEKVRARAIPKIYELGQNSPNPFNPFTTIPFGLPKNADITLYIHDINGRLVMRYILDGLNPGYYQIQWNAIDLSGRVCPNGLYVYTLKTSDWVKCQKMVLIK
ncbi:MAG: hypothetical protein A2268_03630 [Candidatus Raymondbacteria bacterium RifOxyA12_full_50_37]|uniref:Uncharacterized protein n=1 Tax=Candidatus Raymondbacteria bacterium RIFOXYD12_FULL_49_13 TaxID=1817890 RepID=A0A1F7F574_UNCRA|nr:MAG: hypothetical protein A2268_03630 [Candidatus Raymondbacteria bacterium RifOxyA12_full_50_37]OGJ91884.1 MAG: hypothetical protein A2248_04700 [Candidatus Raymondbacteria bacterium RIFOXYA2_FULL_49_16]OGJ98077.1 MAG: hypothetical protein A2453_12315 [Candidatus Raymondbacteria bacterium RIFOXYC2_FULL_50_21]OGK01666.1 MAG: hypothetical protein A2519_09045 [Candidatus Raymondbacteria bacterium RIFOXYD12_FULL_49_13]OGK02335.1 MAG: hypothetical protein A2350_03115 [Candidatus Raymondbacteria 